MSVNVQNLFPSLGDNELDEKSQRPPASPAEAKLKMSTSVFKCKSDSVSELISSVRVSYFDSESPESGVSQSGLQGWINCGWVCMSVFAVCRPIVYRIETGSFLGIEILLFRFTDIGRLQSFEICI
jgi:hypothetical protein